MYISVNKLLLLLLWHCSFRSGRRETNTHKHLSLYITFITSWSSYPNTHTPRMAFLQWMNFYFYILHPRIRITMTSSWRDHQMNTSQRVIYYYQAISMEIGHIGLHWLMFELWKEKRIYMYKKLIYIRSCRLVNNSESLTEQK